MIAPLTSNQSSSYRQPYSLTNSQRSEKVQGGGRSHVGQSSMGEKAALLHAQSTGEPTRGWLNAATVINARSRSRSPRAIERGATKG